MKKFLSSAGWWLSGVLWIGGVFLMFAGGAWIGDRMVPWVNLGATIALLIGVPISLVLLVFPKTREWGGLIIYVLSWPWGLWLWLVALVYAVSVSFFWAIAGVLLGGVGVVPVAVIMMLVRRDWHNLAAIAGPLVLVIVLRWVGLGIMGRAEERQFIEQLRVDQEPPSPAN